MTNIPNEPNTVPELLRVRAKESPDSVAFSYEDNGGWRTITWGDFYRRTRVLAAALKAKGLAPGEHVGMLAPTGLGWELFHHAILTAGGVVVGLEPHDVPDRLQWIADHAEIRMLVVQDEKLLAKLSAQQVRAYRAVVLLAGARPQTADGDNLILWSELEVTTEPPRVLPDVDPNASATLIYTSGTTGQPKGILYRHDQVALAVRAITRAYPSIQVGARFVCWLPLSNLFQRIMNLAAMKVGGTVYLVSNPLDVMKTLPEARPDVFIGVPRFYEKLYDGIEKEIERKPAWLRSLIRWAVRVGQRSAALRREGKALSHFARFIWWLSDALVLQKLRSVMGGRIRFMITGSAPTPVRLLEFFDGIGLPLYEAYGLSENVVPMALNRPSQRRIGTVGRPLVENALRLEDDGELLVRGPGIFSGYFRNNHHGLFTDDGYYRTGDYASFDADGYLRLRGRKSEILKTSTGRRISPVGIEARLEESPYIDRTVVIGDGRKCLCAIVTLTPAAIEALNLCLMNGDSNGAADFMRQVVKSANKCSEALAEHERPSGYVILRRQFSLASGELTPNLKLKRIAIGEAFAKHIDDLYARIESGHCDEFPCVLQE